MNKKTRMKVVGKSLTINAAGAIVAGVQNQMPIVGGNIERLPFIPDNVIVAGYFEDYLLAERAGTKVSQSEHAQFIQDNTLFKGTARYDGMPVIPEAFVVIGIEGTTPDATAVTFPTGE
jgi:HK97 family phage major capsid protein